VVLRSPPEEKVFFFLQIQHLENITSASHISSGGGNLRGEKMSEAWESYGTQVFAADDRIRISLEPEAIEPEFRRQSPKLGATFCFTESVGGCLSFWIRNRGGCEACLHLIRAIRSRGSEVFVLSKTKPLGAQLARGKLGS